MNKVKVILPRGSMSEGDYKTITSAHEIIDETERQLVLRVSTSEANTLVERYNGLMDVSEKSKV